MQYKAKYLITVIYDRDAIKAYLDQYSPAAAKRLFDKIKSNMELVKENPYMYEVYERRPQFRRMVVEDYLVFYKVKEEERIIEVHHIFSIGKISKAKGNTWIPCFFHKYASIHPDLSSSNSQIN